ncbi:MAG: putative phytoene synthase [Polaromonas sp.]|jgi:phytoene synthase|nr:putative phytoene synthase [Polaromonas sp.]
MAVDASLLQQAAQTIRAGSKSFATAARLFDESTRQSAVLLYAWCRHCDDLVDGQQLGHGQQQGDRSDGLARLAALERATRLACAGEPADGPVFAGLAEVVRRHAIPDRYLLEHLAGFRMDVEARHYARLDDTLAYCWRVAGVVGVMMAMVMGNRNPATLDRACDLGMAFQLTNIARDVVEDAAIGRIYLPATWLADEGILTREDVLDPVHRAALSRVAARLVDAADPYYRSAVAGIGELPLRSAWSIATARGVYRDIGRKVKAHGAHAWDTRISTTRMDKLWFLARGAAVAVAAHGITPQPRAAQLWKRPV